MLVLVMKCHNHKIGSYHNMNFEIVKEGYENNNYDYYAYVDYIGENLEELINFVEENNYYVNNKKEKINLIIASKFINDELKDKFRFYYNL